MTEPVLIHFQNTDDVKNHLKDLDLEYQEWNNELEVIVDNIPYTIKDGIYQDPDVQLCEHYGIDYDLVGCIELA